MKQFIKYSTILILTIIFSSCNITEKTENENLEQKDGLELVSLNEDKSVIVKEDYYGTYSFSNWNNYNLANIRMHEIESVDFEVPISRIGNVNSAIVNMEKDIPNWLKTDKILSNLKKVQKEYEILVEERDSTTQHVRENLEDLSEKFDDLREELDKRVEDYTTE